MKYRFRSSWSWALVALIGSSQIYGCAENVSHKVGVVKADLAKLMVLVDQPASGEVNVMAKASSVLASITYEKDAAVAVQKSIGAVLPSLGYQRLISKKLSSNQQVFCHITEPARSVLVERLPIEPLTLSISVSISGWKADMTRCPGKLDAP